MSVDFPPCPTELLETFDELEDWQDRYEFLLDLGRELPRLDAESQTAENRVHGCMSTVWLIVEAGSGEGSPAEQPVSIRADSDSLIVRGLIVILMSLYQGKSTAQSLDVDPDEFFTKLGLNRHLSPNRRNGLYSMVGRLRELCVRLAAGIA